MYFFICVFVCEREFGCMHENVYKYIGEGVETELHGNALMADMPQAEVYEAQQKDDEVAKNMPRYAKKCQDSESSPRRPPPPKRDV